MLRQMRRLRWLVLGIAAIVLVMGAAACTGEAEPTPTPTATPTPTPTPMPTPTPTPEPLPVLITANPQMEPQAFLQAIPSSERECLVRAFGEQGLAAVMGQGIPSQEAVTGILGCISEDTARRAALGTILEQSGGVITEGSLACFATQVKGISFKDLMAELALRQSQFDPAMVIPVVRAGVNCLTEPEFAALTGMVGVDAGLTLSQVKCVFAGANDESLAKLFAVFTSQSGESPPFDVLMVLLKCGMAPGAGGTPPPTPGPAPSGGGSPAQLTALQLECVTASIGAVAVSELQTGMRLPTPEEAQKVGACGVRLGPGGSP